MKITYDEGGDVLRILLAETPIETVNRSGEDLTLDYDQDGILVGLEMRNTALYLQRPGPFEVDILRAGHDGDAAKDSHGLQSPRGKVG